MIFNKEIHTDKGINKNGKAVIRNAIRGIVIENGKILLVKSKKNGDYKFPGGGIEEGETHEDTLKREVSEESGYNVDKIKCKIGIIYEYGISSDPDYDIFMMTSHYYLCTVSNVKNKQKLDKYEKELGFTPKWTTLDHAIKSNEKIIKINSDNLPKWILRETEVLKHLSENINYLTKKLE